MNQFDVLGQFAAHDVPEPPTPLDTSGQKVVFGPKRKAWYRIQSWVSPKSGKEYLFGWFGFKDNWYELDATAPDFSAEERASFQRAREEAERLEKEKRAKQAQLAANRARGQWDVASTEVSSPYLIRKKVGRAESVRLITEGSQAGWIIIPLVDYASTPPRVMGSQKISADGEKLFNKGMDKIGASCRLGPEPVDGDLIYLAEGYATAASAREALAYAAPVYMAVDAGNLPHVALALRGRYPASPFVFLADDDYLTGNRGRIKALAAAKAVGNSRVLLPAFVVPRAQFRDDPDAPELTDFNDLHVAEGIAAVRAIFLGPDFVEETSCAHFDETKNTPPRPLGEADVGEAENASPRPPTEAEGAGDLVLNLDYMTRHWCVVWGTTDVWDALERQRMKERAAKQLAGKALYDAWRDLPADKRRKIKPSQLSGAAPAQGGGGALEEWFDRYVLLYGTTDVYDRYSRKRFGLDALKASLGKGYADWIDGNKKQIPVENLIFDPLQRHDPGTHINTFDGLPLVPDADVDKCRPIIYLLRHLCRDEGKEAYDWLLKWLAYPLQHVGAKMSTAVIMHGDTHGTGKSMFWELVYKRIFGRYTATLGQGQLESNWTEWKSEKLFVLFEEILNRSDKYSHIGEIKHAITGATHQISKKFLSTWEEANHLNMAFLSNEHQPIPVEPSDRRFLVIWTRETLPPEWQQRLDVAIDNGGVEAFYHYLLTLNLGNFGPNTKPPMTRAKERLIDFGLPSWELFYRDWTDGLLNYAPFTTCRSEDLYTAYCRYCSRSGERALPQNKVLNLLSTRVPRERKHYQSGAGTRQATLFIINGPGDGVDAAGFYARAIQDFQSKLAPEGRFDD